MARRPPIPRCAAPGCTNKLVYEDGRPKPAGTKTCSPACRARRARWIKRKERERQTKPRGVLPGTEEIAEVVSGDVKDAAHEVMKEQLAPIMREQLTGEVLGGIGELVAATPRAIELLKKHMESDDETISQRAVTLLLKYTMGNPSVAPPPTAAAPGGLTVHFNVPRPGDEPGDAAAPEPDAVEMRECQDCHKHKPAGEFVGNSERCRQCFDATRDLLRERFGEAYRG